MAVTPLTRPPAGEPRDYAKLATEMDQRVSYRRSTERHEDSRLSQVFMWGAGIVGTVMTFAICYGCSALIEMRSDIAVLLARPASVEKEEYNKDYTRLSEQVNRIEGRLTSIEGRQIETVTKHP